MEPLNKESLYHAKEAVRMGVTAQHREIGYYKERNDKTGIEYCYKEITKLENTITALENGQKLAQTQYENIIDLVTNNINYSMQKRLGTQFIIPQANTLIAIYPYGKKANVK